MSNPSWPLVPLSEVVVPVHRTVTITPGISYRTLGVKWWGEGAYERQTIDGAQTAAKTLNQVNENDLIINKIWVRHGSVAVVGQGVAGCYGSNEFPTFEFRRELIDPRWMHWYSKSQELWTKCDLLSHGTSGKNRIRPEKFMTVEVPLPPLKEQQRIISRIDSLASKVTEAHSIRQRANQEYQDLCRSILRDNRFGEPLPTPMSELVTLRKPDTQVVASDTYQFAGVYCFGRGVFSGQQRSGMDFAYKQLTRIRAGEFIYPKLMAWEGALGIVPNECDGHFVSPEFPVFAINQERVFPEVLEVYFRSPSVWPSLGGASTGTNVRRRRLNPNDFLKYSFPLPTRRSQMALRAARSQQIELESLQNQSPIFDAMLPSILDSAFKGAL